MAKKTSKTQKVLAALQGGAELTAKQITARYRVGNVSAMISSLRMQGYPIYLNKRTITRGKLAANLGIREYRQGGLWL